METITSLQNAYIKMLRSLRQKKAREEHKIYMAEGEKCAEEALEAGLADCILSTEENRLTRAAESQGIRTVLCTNKIMEAVSEAKSPQGIAAVVKKREYTGQLEGDILVALESVSDPQNVGTIIRTADAVGAGGILLSADSADYTSPKAVRAAMGSIFHLPIKIAEDFHEELRSLQNSGTTLIAGHLKGSEHISLTGKACILIGNEARGLSEQAAAQADICYRIPIYGRAESLNAAVAAGIIMYQVRGKLGI